MDPSEQQSDLGLQDFIDQVDAAFRDENMVSYSTYNLYFVFTSL